jgi:hypothetical protein
MTRVSAHGWQLAEKCRIAEDSHQCEAVCLSERGDADKPRAQPVADPGDDDRAGDETGKQSVFAGAGPIDGMNARNDSRDHQELRLLAR